MTSKDLADLLEQRRAIDRELQEKHAVTQAVLFTDIVGSTAYFEQRGDVEGLALVHRHNDMLFPLVGKHGGRIVKTIGDAIMAVFDSANDAVVAAVAMQTVLANDAALGHEGIHIRIGVHVGAVLRDKDDVFGDTVNVAARVNSACAPDEVLVTDAVVAALPAGHSHELAPRPPIAAKGKAAPVPASAVIWRADDVVEERVRGGADKLFVLSVERGPLGLRVSAMDGDAGKGTVNRHVDVSTSIETLQGLADELRTLCHDGGQAAYKSAVADKGKALSAAIFPESIMKRLQATTNRALRLHLDDATARIPFELALLPSPALAVSSSSGVPRQGLAELGVLFAVGRVVSAPDVDAALPTSTTAGHEVVVVADPDGTLPAAREEGELVAKLYESVGATVRRLIGPSTKGALQAAVSDCAVLHLAAHVEKSQFGVVCSDGVVDGAALRGAFGQHTPGLVVANACHASMAAPWATATFTRALLDAGVPHVVAPLWSVPDTDARSFALRFTEAALAGAPLGEATRRGRIDLRDSGTGPLSFAGYVLFGDPRQLMPLPKLRLVGAGRTRSGDLVVPARLATATEAPALPQPSSSSSSPLPKVAAAAAIVIAGIAVAVAVARDPPPSPPAAALTRGEPPPPSAAPPEPRAPEAPVDRTGPVRLSVLPFKGELPGAPAVGAGVTEALVTELSGMGGIKLIERGQIDVDIGELDFQHSDHVDPATRAALGRIVGAEVVVVGGVASVSSKARLTARFVDVESGEVLATAKVDGAGDDLFALQDALAAQVQKQLPAVITKLRPKRGVP